MVSFSEKLDVPHLSRAFLRMFVAPAFPSTAAYPAGILLVSHGGDHADRRSTGRWD